VRCNMNKAWAAWFPAALAGSDLPAATLETSRPGNSSSQEVWRPYFRLLWNHKCALDCNSKHILSAGRSNGSSINGEASKIGERWQHHYHCLGKFLQIGERKLVGARNLGSHKEYYYAKAADQAPKNNFHGSMCSQHDSATPPLCHDVRPCCASLSSTAPCSRLLGSSPRFFLGCFYKTVLVQALSVWCWRAAPRSDCWRVLLAGS
jgi:hypothetical protein